MKPPLPGHASTRRVVLTALLLTVLALSAYVNILDAPFIFDDRPNITGNPRIRMNALSLPQAAGAAGWPSLVRSTAYLTFGLNYYFGGYNPLGYHLVNITIHVMSALILYLIVTLTLGLADIKKGLIPVSVSVIWLLHPLHTQSVTYIVQRMNALAVLFFLLSLYFYLRARISQQKSSTTGFKAGLLFLGCAATGLLAVFSKEIAVTLPIIICLYEWYFFQNLTRLRLSRYFQWIGVAATIGVIIVAFCFGNSILDKIQASYSEQVFTPVQRLLTEPRVIIYYLSLLFFPHPARLNIDYDFPLSTSPFEPVTTILAMTAIAALLVAAFYRPGKHRLLSFTIFWFLGNLFIESSFIGLAIIFEHRTYLPSIFPVFLSVTLFIRRIPRPVAAVTICLIITTSLIWTFQRNTVWNDTLTLWEDCARKSPRLARPANGVGLAYQTRQQPDQALAWFQKSIQLQPDYHEAYSNIGGILVNQGRIDEAVYYLEKAIAIEPASHVAFSNLGSAMKYLHRPDDAIAFYRKSINIYPDYETAHNNLGAVLTETGDIVNAIYHLNRAIEINPGYYEPYSNLGLAMMQQGKTREAIACYRKALELNPEYATAHFNLGTACFQMQDLDCARRHLEEAARFAPDPVLALNNLTAVLVIQKEYGQAIEALKRMAGLRPESTTIYYNLACAYALDGRKQDAIKALSRAVDLGYDHWERMKKDPDLENIRDTDYYKRLVRLNIDEE